MARVPEVIRRNPISQVAPQGGSSGQGWAALAELASVGADFTKPAAMKQASEEGLKAVYRDQDGTLKVAEKSVLGGELADAHNTAAFAKYLAQRKIDMSQTFTELAQRYEFDPAGFKEAANGYVRILQEDEQVPAALKEDLLLDAQQESNSRFNGLYRMETDRTQRDADRNTSTHRDMLVNDYVNLYMQGDEEAAEAKLKEIEDVSSFRANAPYISETPAEREQFLRGTRAAAKVARLTQRMNASSGDSEVSDELRAEMDAVLKDPDIDPDTRRKLDVVVTGRLKGVMANAAVDGLTASGYEAKVIRVESGGKANAKAATSSATGLHQFTDGTWLGMVKDLRAQGGAKWADGLSTSEILAARTNGAASSEVFQYFRQQNAAVLSRAGLPVTDATEYMAHFFGAGGAVTVLSADPGAMLKDVLPAATIKANPFLANMTAQDARNWAARKMTMKSSDIALQQSQLDLIEDTEVRAMASSALNDRYAIRKRMEDAASLPYQERIGAKDDTLTEREISEDHNLSDAMQGSLIKELREQRKDQIAVQETIGRLNDPTVQWNPYDSAARKDVNAAYKSVLGDEDPLSPQGQVSAGEIAVRTGFLPQRAFDSIRSAVNGKDPQALASAMEFTNQVISRQPNAVGMYVGKGEVLDALADYTFKSGFMGAEQTATEMIEARSPEAVAKRKNLSEAAKTAAKGLKPADVTDFFSGRGVSVDLSNADAEGAVMDEYDRLFRDAYVSTGDASLAKNRALTQMASVYGADEVTGSNRFMKFPPQNFYPMPAEEMRAQIEADVSGFAYGSDAKDTFAFTPLAKMLTGEKWVDANRITILSDERTRAEVSAGNSPSYQVMYTDDDGALQMINQRYTFDPSGYQAKQRQEAKGEMKTLQEGQAQDGAVRNLRAWRTHLEKQGFGVEGALNMVLENKTQYSAAPPPME